MDYIDYKEKKYPARDIDKVPEYEDEGTVTVADYALWLAMEDDYNNEDENAHGIDNEVFAYVRPGFLESNPTDDELRSYLNGILN